MKAIEVQSPDLKVVTLVFNSTDEQGTPVSNNYNLTYDYRAIKRFEDATGVDLKDFQQWKNVKSSVTPELVHAGLAKYHPEVTLDQVTDQLNPEAQATIQDAIFELLFPGVLEKVAKFKADQEKGEIPNAQSEASAVA